MSAMNNRDLKKKKKKKKKDTFMTSVGTRFATQAQNVWDLDPVSPVQ